MGKRVLENTNYSIMKYGALLMRYPILKKKEQLLKEGIRIKITYLPPCINGRGTPNPYIGMEGRVHDLRDGLFDLDTGKSWLVGVKVKDCKFEILEEC